MDSRYFLILALCIVDGKGFLLGDNDEYQVWLTTGDQTKLLERQPPVQASHAHYGYSVWVDRNKRRQIIDGFGAAITNSAAYVIYHSPHRHEIMEDLFGNGLDQLGRANI